MSLVKYHYRSAHDAGVKELPGDQMIELGFQIKKLHSVDIADFIIFEVENVIEPLPDYVEKMEDFDTIDEFTDYMNKK
jgi:hypothetical protein